jgi:hypothetical protein
VASPSNSKIRRFLNHAPLWQRYPALVIFFYPFAVVSKALIYRSRNGGWDMDWAVIFEDALYFAVLFGLFAALLRKGVGKNGQAEQPHS